MNLKIGDLIVIYSRSPIVLSRIDSKVGYIILNIKSIGYKDSCIYTLLGNKKIFDFKIWHNSSCQIKKINE